MITRDQIIATLDEVIQENPGMKNPRAGIRYDGSCLYTKHENDPTPNAARRCLGGMILEKFDIKMPPEGVTVAHHNPLWELFEENAIELMIVIQRKADHLAARPGKTWEDVVDELALYGYL